MNSNYFNFIELARRAISLANLGDHKEAIIIYEKILHYMSYEFETWKNLSTSLLQVGKFDDAIKCAKRAIKESSNYIGRLPQKTIEDINQMAEVNIIGAYKQKGEYYKAIDRGETALKKYTANERLLNNLASAQMAVKEYKKALMNLEKALKINPSYEHAKCMKGQIQYIMGHHQKAIKILKEVVESNPYNIYANIALSFAYKEIHKNDEYLKYENVAESLLTQKQYVEWKTYIEVSMKGVTTKELVHYKASLEMNLRNFHKAVELWSSIIEDYSEDVCTLNAYGYSLYEIGRHNDAIIQFQKIISIDKNFDEAYLNISRYYLDAKHVNIEKAIYYSTKAIELNPNLDMAWNNRAWG